MKVLFSPIVKYKDQQDMLYEFEGHKIRAYYDGEVDEFDFTGIPDGELDTIETSLKVNPVESARIVEGELMVTLLNFINEDEASPDVLYPEWKEVINVKDSMEV